MKPKIGPVTLGVRDLKRSTAFCRDGLRLPVRFAGEDVVFFELEGTWLALYPYEMLAEDARVQAEGSGFAGVTLAHNEASREAVDHVYAEALEAGARDIKRPENTAWGGYSGYFADPDGYLWEIAWNPHMDFT